MSLIQDYFLKTEKYSKEYGEKTIVFIQVGSFYEVYGKKEKDKITGSQIVLLMYTKWRTLKMRVINIMICLS
jgi:DNA mismatch repair protein MutS